MDVDGIGDSVYRLGNKAMQWGGTRKEPDRSVLHVTPVVTLRGIPEEAHTYVVNGVHHWSGLWTGYASAGTRKAASSTIQHLVLGQSSRVGVASAPLGIYERRTACIVEALPVALVD